MVFEGLHINQHTSKEKRKKKQKEPTEAFDPNNSVMSTFFQSAQKAAPRQAEETNNSQEVNFPGGSEHQRRCCHHL